MPSGVAALGLAAPASAQEKVLKIGVLGVMSGPAASWGLVNKYSAEATAKMYNDKGGVEIDGEKYKIEIVRIDDKNDPKLTVSGAERLIHQDGIKYIIGPNVDTTAASIVPVVEKNGAMYFPYSFTRALYSPPHENMVLGHDRALSGRADHLQVSDGKPGREVGRLRRPQRLRRAQPARRRAWTRPRSSGSRSSPRRTPTSPAPPTSSR